MQLNLQDVGSLPASCFHQKKHKTRLKNKFKGDLELFGASVSPMTLRYHVCFMVMSDVKDVDGELMRMFQHSSLWYRRIVADVQLLTGTDFVVPDLNRVPGPLSKAQKHKQWISGEQVYLKTMKALFKGMSTTARKIFPYDA